MEDSQNLERQILLEHRLSTLEEHLKHQDRKLDRILSQVEKTNGRVTALEQWKAVMKSNIAIVGAIVSAIVSVVVSIITTTLDR
jgi:uncharacterized coiled-coil protein SlyX